MDLKGLDLYKRGKAIRRFINSDTKIVEDYADTMIRTIFRRYGINLGGHNEIDFEKALIELKHYGVEIIIKDFYKDIVRQPYNCEIIETTKNGMTILLEDNRYLECGVEIKEAKVNEVNHNV